jgi:hypothetical protein
MAGLEQGRVTAILGNNSEKLQIAGNGPTTILDTGFESGVVFENTLWRRVPPVFFPFYVRNMFMHTKSRGLSSLFGEKR